MIIYLHSDNIAALRSQLLATDVHSGGVHDGGVFQGNSGTNIGRSVAFAITRTPYMPRGEFRVHDLDGYVLLLGELEKPVTRILHGIEPFLESGCLGYPFSPRGGFVLSSCHHDCFNHGAAFPIDHWPFPIGYALSASGSISPREGLALFLYTSSPVFQARFTRDSLEIHSRFL